MFPRRVLGRAPSDSEPHGQILVIVAAGLIVMVAMVGIVVDAGYAWGQQRDNQNSADAASEAGAVVLAKRLTGISQSDADVLAAVNASTASNGVTLVGAWYANCNGDLVDSAGAPVASEADAAAVGGGAIPPALCPAANHQLQADVRLGVRAETRKDFETFLVSVIGFPTLSTFADATAVSGYIEEVCPADGDCLVLPVTIPLGITTCDANGDATLANPVTEWLDPDRDGVLDWSLELVIPLCKNNPGNVGWLDWTPTAGGTSELVTAIGPPTTQDEMSVPGWFYVTATGNINSAAVENAIEYYMDNNMPVLIPMFDSTCDTEPDPPSPGVSDVERCPPANVGGNGSNQWYHLDRFVSIRFTGVYISGSNQAECEQNGNGATSCLTGQFVKYVGPGATVGAGNGQVAANAAVGIQLIK
jgi:Flp pilus assembly protein TadG